MVKNNSNPRTSVQNGKAKAKDGRKRRNGKGPRSSSTRRAPQGTSVVRVAVSTPPSARRGQGRRRNSKPAPKLKAALDRSPLPSTSQHVVDLFLEQVSIPDKTDFVSPAIPLSLCGNLQIASSKLQSTTEIDFAVAASEFQTAATAPSISPIGTTDAIPLWARGAATRKYVPIIQCQDPSFPFCLPLVSVPKVDGTTYRTFQYKMPSEIIHMQPNGPAANSTASYTYDALFETVGEAVAAGGGAEGSYFPVEFRRRPVFANRVTSDTRNYVWADANPIQRALLRTRGNVVNTDVISGENRTLSLQIQATRISSDGSEEKVSRSFNITFVQTSLSTVIPIFCDLEVGNSGFYKLSYFFTIARSGGVPASDDSVATWQDMIVEVDEHTELGTAWYENRQWTGLADRVGAKMWPIGVSSVFSFRGNVLQNAGSINALNVSDIQCPMWYQVASRGQSELSSAVTPHCQYGGGSGGPIQKGLWAYARPGVWWKDWIPITDSRFASSSAAPTLSYWVNTNAGPTSLNVLYFFPTSAADVPSLPLRISTYTTTVYTLRTQFISPCAIRGLTPDNLATAYALLAAMPNFSENDWHSFFSTIARGASSLVETLKKGAQLISDVAPHMLHLTGHAVGVAEAIGSVAALIA